MAVYLQAVIRSQPGQFAPLLELITSELVPIMEAAGWKLHLCLTGKTGPINTIIDIWELEEMEHFQRAYAQFMRHPSFPAIRARLDQMVAEETLTFCDRKR